MEEIRVLVADDHQVRRRGICSIVELQPGWSVCGKACTGLEAVEMAKALQRTSR